MGPGNGEPPDLFSPDEPTSDAEVVPLWSPTADGSMRARWRALVLTDPVARLVRHAGQANVDDTVFDLHQLALAAIDVAVASMGFARQITLAGLVDTLADLARSMAGASAARQHAVDAARWVIRGLLNDAEGQAAFVYEFRDVRGERLRGEEYAFKLLQLMDGPTGAVVQPSPQAVMLYLNGLDLDVDDTEAALSVVLKRQLEDRRFEAAGRTAADAERASIAMAANLADVLEGTRRDVRSFDWMTDIPVRLDRAQRHSGARIEADGEVIDHVTAGMDTETNPAVRRASGELVETLRRIRQVHLDLASRAGSAREVFLRVQVAQVFARPTRLRLLRVEQELFHPVLDLSATDACQVTDVFADRVLGLKVPRVLHFDNLIDTLLAPPLVLDPPEYEPEEPGASDEIDLQSYPPAVVAAASAILRRADEGRTPLSELVEFAHAVPAEDVDGAVDAVVELVTLSVLWSYAPDRVEETERRGDLESLVAGLSAERAAGVVDTVFVWGDELTVAQRSGSGS